MTDPLRILLVSPDLMVSSRVAALAVQSAASLDTIHGLESPPPRTGYRVVIVDLQGLPGDAGDIVRRARERFAPADPAAGPSPAVVAFGPHVAVERLTAARDANADEVVSRGELLGGFAGVLGRVG